MGVVRLAWEQKSGGNPKLATESKKGFNPMNLRPLSVKERQIKKLRPRNYEIMTRLLQYQSLRTISCDMGINESWASVVVNSPVFQKELDRRLEIQEKAVIEKLREREERRLEQLARLMRGQSGDPGILDEPSVLERLQREVAPAGDSDGGDPSLGDRLVRVLRREKKAQVPVGVNIEPYNSPQTDTGTAC
jgi:hypothetical protein